MGMLFCKFYCASPSVKLKLNKSLIRPLLEYACVTWDLHLLKDIYTLEKVQKFALRVCSGDWTAKYDSLQDEFKIISLSKSINSLKSVLSIEFSLD